MDKAKQMALQKYPPRKDGVTRAWYCTDDDVRFVYAQGYRKAEKDLALTWEDISTIIRLYNNTMSSPSVIQWGFGSDIHYQIVLDEFNKRRNTLQNDT